MTPDTNKKEAFKELHAKNVSALAIMKLLNAAVRVSEHNVDLTITIVYRTLEVQYSETHVRASCRLEDTDLAVTVSLTKPFGPNS